MTCVNLDASTKTNRTSKYHHTCTYCYINISQNRNMFSLIFTRFFPTKPCFKEWRASIRNYMRKQERRFPCKLLTAT